MKWGILATGNIAQKFASTLKQMEGEGEVLTAAGVAAGRKCGGLWGGVRHSPHPRLV